MKPEQIIEAAREYAEVWAEHLWNPSHGKDGSTIRVLKARAKLVDAFYPGFYDFSFGKSRRRPAIADEWMAKQREAAEARKAANA